MAEQATALAPEGDGTSRPAARAWLFIGLLTFVAFFSYMDRVALAILVEPIKADLHLSDTQIGLVTGLGFALFYAVMGLPLGRLADRVSRVRLLSASLLAWSAMCAATGLARGFGSLLLARIGVGVGEAGGVPASHSLIGDYVGARWRPLAISIFQLGGAIGLSLGLLVVGLLERRYGWRVALQAIGLGGVPLSLLIAVVLREPARRAGRSTSAEPWPEAVRALLRRPALVHLLIAYALSSGCLTGAAQWIPAFLIRTYGVTVAQVGAWEGGASFAASTVGLLLGGWAGVTLAARDQRWELWIPAIGFGACGPLFAAAFLSPNFVAAVVLKNLAVVVAAAGGGTGLSAIQSFAEPNRRGLAISMVLFAAAIVGSGAIPFAIGAVSDLLTPALGRNGLRCAMLLVCVTQEWGLIHYLLAARASLRDRVGPVPIA